MMRLGRFVLGAMAAVVATAGSVAHADGLIILPPQVPDQPHVRNVPLWVKYHRVTVTVKDRVAVTDVDQVFVNPNPRRLEGTYIFPLPKNATIDRFSMWVDGQELSAELLDAAQARSIYEGIVRSQQDPALLEYAEQGLFRARIFPIEPNGEKRVRIRYAEVLPADNGTVSYLYPLNTEKFSSRPLSDVSVKVTVDAGGPVGSFYSPSHRIDVPKDLSGPVTVGWEDRNVTPDRDFLLYWRPTRKDVGVSVVAHRDAAADPEGTFLLVLSPTDGEESAKTMPKDVVFVVDTSGSMAGKKMEQARAALRYCLRSLRAEDRFALVPFSTEPRPFRDALATADGETMAAAEKFVDGLEARGGTAIADSLRVALSILGPAKEGGRPGYVLFLTDGLPTIGVTDVETILRDAADGLRDRRVFAFGVGSDVNTRLLDRLAEGSRGTRTYVAESESIEEKVGNLFAKIAHPALTDVSLSFEGVAVSAVHPRGLGDLFHGGEVLVTGRFAGPGNAVLRLRGKRRGADVEVVEEIRFPEAETGNGFLPRLWAVRRVGFLLDEMRRVGETSEVKDEVVKLARRFGIVTPYTSYLIVEDQARPQPGAETRSGLLPPQGPGLGAGGGGRRAGEWDAGAPEADAPAATPEEAEALDRVGKAAERARDGAKKESGDDAVGLSSGVDILRDFKGDKDAEALDLAKGLVRHVAGRTFVSRGGVWWEVGVDLAVERKVIESFSSEYFALVRENAALGAILKLGKVVFRDGDRIVEIG